MKFTCLRIIKNSKRNINLKSKRTINLENITGSFFLTIFFRILRSLLNHQSRSLHEHDWTNWTETEREKERERDIISRNERVTHWRFTNDWNVDSKWFVSSNRISSATNSCLAPPFYASFVSCGNFRAILPPV